MPQRAVSWRCEDGFLRKTAQSNPVRRGDRTADISVAARQVLTNPSGGGTILHVDGGGLLSRGGQNVNDPLHDAERFL
jgi:hypothetical protein